MRPLSTLKFILFISLAITSNAFADVIIDNLSGNTNADISLGVQGRSAAVGFTMPAEPSELESLTLRISASLADPPFVVRLFDNNVSNNPGTELLSFTNPTIPVGRTDLKFLPATPFTLEANTTYWIVVHVVDGHSSPGWTSGNPSIIPTGVATYFGAKFDLLVEPNPPTTDFVQIGAFAVNVVPPATATSVPALPPLNLALLVLLMGLAPFVVKRYRAR